MNKEYALYKGDEILAIGNIEEIAKKMKVDYRTIKFYTTKTWKKRSKGSFKRRTMVEL